MSRGWKCGFHCLLQMEVEKPKGHSALSDGEDAASRATRQGLDFSERNGLLSVHLPGNQEHCKTNQSLASIQEGYFFWEYPFLPDVPFWNPPENRNRTSFWGGGSNLKKKTSTGPIGMLIAPAGLASSKAPAAKAGAPAAPPAGRLAWNSYGSPWRQRDMESREVEGS